MKALSKRREGLRRQLVDRKNFGFGISDCGFRVISELVCRLVHER